MILEKNLLVSVCVPVYKVERYMERCAKSLFEQTYENIEYIFIDDCSPDDSIPILMHIVDNYPHRRSQVRIVRHKVNSGLGVARNTGVREAKGDFILHVDSDDYIDDNVVERLVARQIETDADIVRYPKQILYKSKTQIEKVYSYSSPRELLENILLNKTPGNVCGSLIRSSLYHDNGIQVEGGVNQSEDFQVITRLLYFANVIASVDDSFYYYDKSNEESYSNIFKRENENQILTSYSVLFDFYRDHHESELLKLLHYGKQNTFFNMIKTARFAGDKQYADYLLHLLKKEYPDYPNTLGRMKALLVNVQNVHLYKLLLIIYRKLRVK